jgi:hypothetical protein
MQLPSGCEESFDEPPSSSASWADLTSSGCQWRCLRRPSRGMRQLEAQQSINQSINGLDDSGRPTLVTGPRSRSRGRRSLAGGQQSKPVEAKEATAKSKARPSEETMMKSSHPIPSLLPAVPRGPKGSCKIETSKSRPRDNGSTSHSMRYPFSISNSQPPVQSSLASRHKPDVDLWTWIYPVKIP